MKFTKMISILALTTSCTTSIGVYKDNNPKLVFDKFFNGDLVAHGLFKDRFNHVKKTFVVIMKATWNGNEGILDEDFIYSDGTKSKRIWKLKKISENKIEGRAQDVDDVAFGEIAGNTLRWKYVLNLETERGVLKVNFDDWMYLIDENNLLNHSYMSKIGIELGEVILNIRKI